MANVNDLETLRDEGLGYRSEEAVIRIIFSLLRSVEELQQTVEVMEKDMWRMKAEIDSLDMKVESQL